MDLSSYKWKNRLLVIFGPSASDRRLVQQQRTVNDNEEGFKERDLLPVYVFEDGPGYVGKERISPEEATATRDAFGVREGDFAVVLVGKDGGEKFRYADSVPAEEIFDRIDAMPMRRSEMRGQRS